MIFVVRAEHNPLSLSKSARRIIRGLDAAQPIAFRASGSARGLLSGFSLVALVLAGAGIYGVLAYAVTARTRELGVRAALGADSGRIITLVLKTGARPVIGGLVIGIAGWRQNVTLSIETEGWK